MSAKSTDITRLILDDHETFRRAFAELDDLSVTNDPEALARAWNPLAALLDVHAIAEEEIFYPRLLRKAADGEDETLDAIGDHNDIRDAVHDAAGYPVGSPQWWEAVGRARAANDEHMGEEEGDALADFRRNAAMGLRQELGERFLAFKAEHPDTRELDTGDKDPRGYVEAVEVEQGIVPARADDASLGIGSLRGR